jgi:chromosome segregation ATPase
MPLPQKVTPELVTRLAAEIYRERQREPTAEEILAQIGGSKSTITRLLRTWREQRTRAEAVVVPEEVRPQLHSVVERAVAELWTIAQQQASAAQAEAKRMMQAHLAEVEHELAEVKASLDSAQQALLEVQAQRDAATIRAEELERRLAEQQRQAESQAGELAEARTSLLQQARELGELDLLRRQVEQQQVLVERQRTVGGAE